MSIFTNLEADFENFWATKIKPFLSKDVEPVLKTFIQQFDSKFGAQALAAALGAVATIETGGGFGVVATGLATTLFADAKADAASGAELTAAQVLQTVQSALQVAKAASGVTTTADQTAATAIAAAPAAS